MSGMQDHIWRGSTFTIERKQNPNSVVFRFAGPFTARDMYANLSPIALHSIFEAEPLPHNAPVPLTIFDLTEVPYMDSCGLGLIIGHFVRCQNKGVRLVAAGVGPRVLQLFQTTKVDRLFPMTATVEEAVDLPHHHQM